ncbi:MAG: ribosome maturation factor RimP [Candidatus Baltobacteraceae bacterium]
MSDLTNVFERELDAIVHDGTFAGVEIVGHAARPRRTTTALSVTIDKAGGVDIALCERIAARINGALEPFDEQYSLEVESAGLERPLVKPADYERFAGKSVRVVTTLLINGQKTHRGTLRGLRGETVILETEAGELPLPMATIKSANLEYDPRADLQRNKRERKTHGRTDS